MTGRSRCHAQTSDRRVVAERVGVSEGTVYRVAKRFAEVGGDVEAAIGRRKRATPPVPAKVTGDVQARVIALACTAPPAGYERWSLRLLERQVVLTDGIPPLDHSTIGRVLKRGSPSQSVGHVRPGRVGGVPPRES